MDVMTNIWMVTLTKLFTFSDLLASFASFTDAYPHCFLCMYSDRSSVQDNERKRCTTGTLPIEYSSLDPASQFPNDMTTIWPSNNNKLLLEKLFYNHLRSDISFHGQYHIVLGQVAREEEDWQCIGICNGKKDTLSSPVHIWGSWPSHSPSCSLLSQEWTKRF